jgi:flagellar biosynthesis protein
MMDKAIALKYSTDLPAPFIIASGRDELARRIVEMAGKFGVPVHADGHLAERLFVLEPGNLIPEECFQVVAELLVFVQAVESSPRR